MVGCFPVMHCQPNGYWLESYASHSERFIVRTVRRLSVGLFVAKWVEVHMSLNQTRLLGKVDWPRLLRTRNGHRVTQT
jgi:hypothetical protein